MGREERWLLRAGHRAAGVDPETPEGQDYHRREFERHEPSAPVDAVVASRSLRHVEDVAEVLDAVTATLAPGGTLIVVEWAWERFDLPTARWRFDRLPVLEADDEPGWLHRLRAQYEASDLPWDAHIRAVLLPRSGQGHHGRR